MTSTTVTILGAGPAGLGAAYRAAALGHKVTILERANRVGGLAGSFDVGGMMVDHGSHRLHPATEPELLGELSRLLYGDLQVRRRHGRIRLDGRWIAFPLEPVDLVRNLPGSFARAAARDALLGPLRRARSDTFAEVLLAGLGPTMCNRFYFPYARKLWGLEPEQIHGEQARRRVRSNAAGKLIRKVVGGGTESGIFYYPRRGFGQLWEALAEGAVESGAQLHLDAAVERVEIADRHFVTRAGGVAHESDLVWSTLPLPALARLMSPGPDEEVVRAASRLRSRAMLLVYLVLDQGRYTEYDAHYVPDPRTPVSRISEPKNYRSGPDPQDRTVLCAEIPCAVDDPVWSMDDSGLGDLVLEALAMMELPKVRPAALEVRRLPSAYPIYDLDYAENLDGLAGWAQSIPGLVSFGRHGLFVHNNSHHALEMGWAAAGALGPGGFDDAAWASSVETFASHVVED